MNRETLIFRSVAARLAAGTYQPRAPRQPSHVPARIVRRAKLAAFVDEIAAPLVSCAAAAAAAFLLAFLVR